MSKASHRYDYRHDRRRRLTVVLALWAALLIGLVLSGLHRPGHAAAAAPPAANLRGHLASGAMLALLTTATPRHPTPVPPVPAEPAPTPLPTGPSAPTTAPTTGATQTMGTPPAPSHTGDGAPTTANHPAPAPRSTRPSAGEGTAGAGQPSGPNPAPDARGRAAGAPEPELVDPDDRAPDPGSAPQEDIASVETDGPFSADADVDPATGPTDQAGGVRAIVVSYLSRPEAGPQLVAAGLAGLIFSIGGLITVGLRRRRW